MQITLKHLLDLNKLFTEQNVAGLDYVSMCVGYDGKVYILFSSKIPPRIDGMFVDTVADAEYTALIVTPSWETGEVQAAERIGLGTHTMNFSFLRPIPDGTFLLLGSRCVYSKKHGPEKNAVFVDREGRVLRELTFGDGIAGCIVREDGIIITSYFDEGVMGNYGWEDPIGSCGVCAWNTDGETVWRSQRDILDCYAMNTDADGNLWYYYYTDFLLVRTDFINETEYDPDVEGADIFAVCGGGKYLIMNGGYDEPNMFYVSRFDGDKIKDPDILRFTDGDGGDIEAVPVAFCGSKAIIMTWESTMSFVEFQDQGC